MPEIEAKLRVKDPGCLEELVSLEAVGPLRVAGRRSVEQTDEYFDTPARDVATARAVVRIRTIAGERPAGRPAGRWFTLKVGAVAAGISGREEVEERAGSL